MERLRVVRGGLLLREGRTVVGDGKQFVVWCFLFDLLERMRVRKGQQLQFGIATDPCREVFRAKPKMDGSSN